MILHAHIILYSLCIHIYLQIPLRHICKYICSPIKPVFIKVRFFQRSSILKERFFTIPCPHRHVFHMLRQFKYKPTYIWMECFCTCLFCHCNTIFQRTCQNTGFCIFIYLFDAGYRICQK